MTVGRCLFLDRLNALPVPVSMSTYRVVGVVTPRQGCFYVSHISHINGAHWAVTQQLYLDVLYKLWLAALPSETLGLCRDFHLKFTFKVNTDLGFFKARDRSTLKNNSFKLNLWVNFKVSQKVFGPANIQLLPIIQPVGGSIAAYKSQIRQVQRSVEVLAGLAWTNIGEDGLAGYVLTHC